MSKWKTSKGQLKIPQNYWTWASSLFPRWCESSYCFQQTGLLLFLDEPKLPQTLKNKGSSLFCFVFYSPRIQQTSLVLLLFRVHKWLIMGSSDLNIGFMFMYHVLHFLSQLVYYENNLDLHFIKLNNKM